MTTYAALFPASNALPDTDPRVMRVHAVMRALGYPIAPVRISRATGPGAKTWRKGRIVVSVVSRRPGSTQSFSIEAEAATLDEAVDALVRYALDDLAQEIRTLRNRGEARRSDAARFIADAERAEAQADALASALATMESGS